MRVLITGCSSGIGRAAATALTKRGHEIVATARRPETLAGLDVPERLALDVDDDASIAAALDAAGPLDALVNNAGNNAAAGPVEKVPLAAVRELFETNFFGAVRMIQAVVPAMRARGRGVVVNVSSIQGRVGVPLSGFYSASKCALEGLSEALHLELSHFGVRVALVQPGYVDTPLRAKSPRHGMDEPPYDALARQFEGADERVVGGARPSPEIVAGVVADAVEGREARLRWPVGRDAEMVLGARAQLDDADFEASMRAVLKLDW